MSKPPLLVGLVLISLAAGVGALMWDDAERTSPAPSSTSTSRPASAAAATPVAARRRLSAASRGQRRFKPYEPPAEEQYANGKRLAGRVGQRLATFGPQTSATELARSAGAAGTQAASLARTVAPLLASARRSTGEVVYVQLSGVTATTLGAMVIVRQHLEGSRGRRTLLVRVMDIRLRRTNGPWSLDRVASVGGSPARRPASVSRAASRVLDHPNIKLPDTARWDIYRGLIDEALLQALSSAADRWPIAVSVLRTGHPPRVWGTKRPSAHAAGKAADIYAIDDRLVLEQQMKGSSAQRLASAFLAAGAAQVGSPWVLAPGGSRSFADRVHRDHLHIQQARSPTRRH